MRRLIENIRWMYEDESTGYDLFITRLSELINDPVPLKAKEFIQWAKDNFAINSNPRGQKDTVQKLEKVMEYIGYIGIGNAPNGYGFILDIFRKIDRESFNKYFVRGGEKTGVLEYKGKHALYKNMQGLSAKRLKEIADRLDSILGDIKGWRAKALNNLVVGLAGPAFFKTKAAGRYSREGDVLYVRATPDIMKRTGGLYGSPEYIIVHELGHRYEEKFGGLKDVDLAQWNTTKYSMSGFMNDEQFAELFALGHFGIKSVNGWTWDSSKQDKFEKRFG